MGNLLTTLAMTGVAPFLFGQPDGMTKPLLVPSPKVAVVVQEKPAPKKEVKRDVQKQETVEVPPTPQVVTYVVQEGDNLTVIAEKHQTSWERLYRKNEQLQNKDQLKVGDTITIPAETENLAERVIEAPVSVPSIEVAQVTPQATEAPYRASGGPNGYAYGWCTWWAKEKRPDIGGYWGNAGYNWIGAAQASGFSTGSIPRPGAIGVTAGHVVYVESVNGSTVNISEMGYGYRANSTPNYRTVPATSFTYIY